MSSTSLRKRDTTSSRAWKSSDIPRELEPDMSIVASFLKSSDLDDSRRRRISLSRAFSNSHSSLVLLNVRAKLSAQSAWISTLPIRSDRRSTNFFNSPSPTTNACVSTIEKCASIIESLGWQRSRRSGVGLNIISNRNTVRRPDRFCLGNAFCQASPAIERALVPGFPLIEIPHFGLGRDRLQIRDLPRPRYQRRPSCRKPNRIVLSIGHKISSGGTLTRGRRQTAQVDEAAIRWQVQG